MNQIHIAIYDPSPNDVTEIDGKANVPVPTIKTLTLNEKDVKELVSMETLWAYGMDHQEKMR